MEERARQIVVVRGQPVATPHPWDEPGATEEGSARVEWLIEPQIHTLYHTALQMLNAPTPRCRQRLAFRPRRHLHNNRRTHSNALDR